MNVKAFFVLAFASVVFVLGFVVFQDSKLNDARLHIIICDVGQGDGIFIRTPDKVDIVVDAGPDTKILGCLSKHMPFWDRTIDAAILTHPHLDHYGGFRSVFKRYTVRSFYTENLSKDTKEGKTLKADLAVERLSAKFLVDSAGFKNKDGVVLKTLSPSRNMYQNTSNDINQDSVVLLLTYGNFEILLTGDAESEVLDTLAGRVGDIDVLKVPHHGSAKGMTQEMLRFLKPELAVASVGKTNRYGHPSKKALETLAAEGIKTMRTDQDGEVEIVSDGKKWWVKTSR